MLIFIISKNRDSILSVIWIYSFRKQIRREKNLLTFTWKSLWKIRFFKCIVETKDLFAKWYTPLSSSLKDTNFIHLHGKRISPIIPEIFDKMCFASLLTAGFTLSTLTIGDRKKKIRVEFFWKEHLCQISSKSVCSLVIKLEPFVCIYSAVKYR